MSICSRGGRVSSNDMCRFSHGACFTHASVLRRAILHDEAAYPDAERYNPDRFLTADGALDPAVRDPSVAAFGFGRRICPGRFMALDSMWITIACVLSMFEISKAVDEDGYEITPDVEYDRGFLW